MRWQPKGRRRPKQDHPPVVPPVLAGIDAAFVIATLTAYWGGLGRLAVGVFLLLVLAVTLAMVLWFMFHGGRRWLRLQRAASVPAVVLVGLIVGIAVALIMCEPPSEPDVRIVGLMCDSDPEAVVIRNSGDEMQSLAGWKLESDVGQVFDLAKAGRLYDGETIKVFSGSEAPDDDPPSGSYLWDHDYKFPDDDARGFARLVTDTGEEAHRLYCTTSSEFPEPETYSGTTSQDRPVEFDLIEGGRAVGRIKFDVEGTCPVNISDSGPQPTGCKCEVTRETIMTTPWPIAANGFSYAPGDFEFSAVFDSQTTAWGFVRIHTTGAQGGQVPCESGHVTWTASVQ